MEENLPPGFRFHPTDEELITYYLTRKVSNFNFVSRAITDVDLNKCEPWDLPGKATMGEKEWYFFSLKDRKYPTGLRTNRATDAGYWKTTGKDKEIFHSGVVAGMKKTLVFYKGRAPKGEKSNWVMHEYRLQSKYPYRPTKEEWVVCRVFHKSSTAKKPPSSPPSLPSLVDTPSEPAFVGDQIEELDVTHISNGVTSSNTQNTDINAESMDGNWAFAGETFTNSSLSWPPALMNTNFVTNASMMRGLHLNPYQPQDVGTSLNSSFAHGDGYFGSNFSSNFPAPSSSVMDPGQLQSVNLDSIWRSS